MSIEVNESESLLRLQAELSGSVLGPALFSIFIDGLDDKVKYPSSSCEQERDRGTVHKKYKSRAAMWKN